MDMIVVKEDAPGDSMSVVLSGSLAVFSRHQPRTFQPLQGEMDDDPSPDRPVHDQWGSHISTLSAGDCFGVQSLLEGVPRSFTLVTLDDVVLGTLTRSDFNALISRFAVFGIGHLSGFPLQPYRAALEAVAASPLPSGPQAALPSHMAIYAAMASSGSNGGITSTPPGSMSLTPQAAYLMRSASISLNGHTGSLAGGVVNPSVSSSSTNGPASGRLGAISSLSNHSSNGGVTTNTPPGSQFSFAPFNNSPSPASSFSGPPLSLPIGGSGSAMAGGSMSQLPIVTEAHLQLLTQLLRQNKLFQMLDYELQQRVAMGLRYVALQPGQVLYHEGDSYDSCYFVISGLLSEHSKDSININGDTARGDDDGNGNGADKSKRRQSGKKNSRRRLSRKGLGSADGKDGTTANGTTPAPTTTITVSAAATVSSAAAVNGVTKLTNSASDTSAEIARRERRLSLSPDRASRAAVIAAANNENHGSNDRMALTIHGPPELSPMPETTIKFAPSPKQGNRDENSPAPAKKFVFGNAGGRDSLHQLSSAPALDRRASMTRGMGAVLSALAAPTTPSSRRQSMNRKDLQAAAAATSPTDGTATDASGTGSRPGTAGGHSPPKDGATSLSSAPAGTAGHLAATSGRVPLHLRGASSTSTSSFVQNFLRPPPRLPPSALFGGKPLDVAAKSDTKTKYGTCRRLHACGSFFGLPSSPKIIPKGHVNTVMALETSYVARLDCAFLRLMVNSPIIQGYNTIRTIVKQPPDERSNQQIDTLNTFVNNLKFFQVQTPDTQLKLCRTLTYERYPAGHIIFQQGDAGDKFYIILSGSASVHIRKDAAADAKKAAAQEPVTPNAKSEAPKMSNTSGTHRPINLAHSSRGQSIQLGNDQEGVRTVMMQLMTHGKPDLLNHKEKRASRRASRKLLRPSRESKEIEQQRREKEAKDREAKEKLRQASNDIDIPIPLDDVKEEETTRPPSKDGSGKHGKHGKDDHAHHHGHHAHGPQLDQPPLTPTNHSGGSGGGVPGAGEHEVGGAKHLKEVHEIKKKLEAESAMAKKPKEFKHISDVDDIEGAFGTCIRVCEAGQSFGESALITNAARGATIICREVTEAMTISKADYRHIFGIPGPEFRKEVPHIRTILQRHQRTPADVEYLNEVLSKMELFSIMPLIMRRFVFTRLGYVKLDQNVLLYEQGQPTTHLYIILSGAVGMYMRDTHKPARIEEKKSGATPNKKRLARGASGRIVEEGNGDDEKDSNGGTSRSRLLGRQGSTLSVGSGDTRSDRRNRTLMKGDSTASLFNSQLLKGESLKRLGSVDERLPASSPSITPSTSSASGTPMATTPTAPGALLSPSGSGNGGASFKPSDMPLQKSDSLARLNSSGSGTGSSHGTPLGSPTNSSGAGGAELFKSESLRRLPGVDSTVRPISPALRTESSSHLETTLEEKDGATVGDRRALLINTRESFRNPKPRRTERERSERRLDRAERAASAARERSGSASGNRPTSPAPSGSPPPGNNSNNPGAGHYGSGDMRHDNGDLMAASAAAAADTARSMASSGGFASDGTPLPGSSTASQGGPREDEYSSSSDDLDTDEEKEAEEEELLSPSKRPGVFHLSEVNILTVKETKAARRHRAKETKLNETLNNKKITSEGMYGPMACILSIGNFFGEESIKHEELQPAITTIITREPTEFITIHRDIYLQTLRKIRQGEAEITQRARFLGSLKVFSALPRATLNLLARSMEEHILPRNTAAIQQGDSNHSVYFITRGSVKLTRSLVLRHGPGDREHFTPQQAGQPAQEILTPHLTGNEERSYIVELTILHEGEIFGAHEVIGGLPMGNTFTPTSDVTVLALKKSFLAPLSKRLLKRLRALDEDRAVLHHQRVLAFLHARFISASRFMQTEEEEKSIEKEQTEKAALQETWMHKMKEQRPTATLSRAGMKCDSVVLAINLAPIKPTENPNIKTPKQWPPDFPAVISTLRELRGSQDDPSPRLISRSNSRRAVAARAQALLTDPSNGSRAATAMAKRPSSASSTFMQSLALSSLSDPFLAAVSASARSAAQSQLAATPSRSPSRGVGPNNGGDGIRITPMHHTTGSGNGGATPASGATSTRSMFSSASEPFLTPTRANRMPRGHHSIGNTPDMTSTSRSLSSNQLPTTPHTPGAGGMLYVMSGVGRTMEEKEAARDSKDKDDDPLSPARAITFNLNDTPTSASTSHGGGGGGGGRLRPRTSDSNLSTSIREEDESEASESLEVRIDDGAIGDTSRWDAHAASTLTPASTRGHQLVTSRGTGMTTPDPIRSHSKRLWEHTLGNSYSVPDLHASRRTPMNNGTNMMNNGAPLSPGSPQPQPAPGTVRSSAPPPSITLPPSMEKMNSVDVLLMGGHARSLSRASSLANLNANKDSNNTSSSSIMVTPSTPSHHHQSSSSSSLHNIISTANTIAASVAALTALNNNTSSSSTTPLPPSTPLLPPLTASSSGALRTPDAHARSLSSVPPSSALLSARHISTPNVGGDNGAPPTTANGGTANAAPPGSAGSMAVAAVLSLGAASVATPTPGATTRRLRASPFVETEESIAIARRADMGVSAPAAEQHPPMARMAGGDINDASVMLRRFHPSRKATITSPILATLRKAHPQLQTDYRTQFSANIGSPATPQRRTHTIAPTASPSPTPAKKKSLTYQPTL